MRPGKILLVQCSENAIEIVSCESTSELDILEHYWHLSGLAHSSLGGKKEAVYGTYLYWPLLLSRLP